MTNLITTLHTLKVWTLLSGACAIVLAVEAVLLLLISSPRSRIWWIGFMAGILGALAVALGERTYGAYLDLQPVATCSSPNCAQWYPWIDQAVSRAQVFGILLICFTAAVLGLGAVIGVMNGVGPMLNREQQRALMSRRLSKVVGGIILLSIGAYLLSHGSAYTAQYMYLAKSQNGGDSLGQIPLIEALIEAVIGLIMVVAGILLVMLSAGGRNRRTQPTPTGGLSGGNFLA